MKILVLAVLSIALAGVSDQPAPDGLMVAGRIVDEARSPIPAAVVSINAQPLIVNANGEYQFVVDSAEPLLIDISTDGYYRVVHTWHRSDFAGGHVPRGVHFLCGVTPPESRRTQLHGRVGSGRRSLSAACRVGYGRGVFRALVVIAQANVRVTGILQLIEERILVPATK
jgi:hypothetical protein